MIKSYKKIIFTPLSNDEVNICHKLKIPFLRTIIFHGGIFPVFIGDLTDEEKYLQIIKEEEKKIKEKNE